MVHDPVIAGEGLVFPSVVLSQEASKRLIDLSRREPAPDDLALRARV